MNTYVKYNTRYKPRFNVTEKQNYLQDENKHKCDQQIT